MKSVGKFYFFFNLEFSEGLVLSCKLDFETSLLVLDQGYLNHYCVVLHIGVGRSGNNVNVFLVNHG